MSFEVDEKSIYIDNFVYADGQKTLTKPQNVVYLSYDSCRFQNGFIAFWFSVATCKRRHWLLRLTTTPPICLVIEQGVRTTPEWGLGFLFAFGKEARRL
jgi:hypothetical protein